MSTIDEAMAQALAAEEGANDDWVKDERYSTKEYYSDADVSIDMERRTIGDISENVSTVGENNAQYISFTMDRYVDGVDLKDMTIQIQAEVSENISAIDGPVNVYYNESKIRFGWAIPSSVAQQAATIEIIVFCTGVLPDGNSYTIKTLPLRYTINDTLNIGGFIPQPDESWYLQFVTTMDEKVTAAINSASAARESATEASESLVAVQDIQSDINQSKSTVQILTTQVQSDMTKAQASADAATSKANSASEYAVISKSYAVGETGVRENEDVDNAQYYYEQAKRISQGLNGIIPMGTVTFANLPTEDIVKNAMYNISDSFVSDERFNDGGDVSYGAGNNVIWTAEGLWDVTASSSVNGVKGAKENTYRQGFVNITPENIGALPENGNANTATKATQDANGNNIVDTYQTKIGDTASNSVAFSSGDSTSPTGWTDILAIESGETHASLFRKFSLAVKNLRYLYKILGTTDISAIGDGTVTGGIGKLNNNLAVRNLKTYTGISLLGLGANNTIDEIMEALPLNSMLVMQIASGTTVLNNSLPTTARGQLEIKKGDSGQRGRVEYKLYDNNVVYVNHYLAGTLGEWDTLALNSDLSNLTGTETTTYEDYASLVIGVHGSLIDGESVHKNYEISNGDSVLVIGGKYSYSRGRYVVLPRSSNGSYIYQMLSNSSVERIEIMPTSVTLFSGSVTDWALTKYLTIDLTEEMIAQINKGEQFIIFTFGNGTQVIGSNYGEPRAIGYIHTFNTWVGGCSIIEGKIAYWCKVDNQLHVWCNENPSLPLRQIYLRKNI